MEVLRCGQFSELFWICTIFSASIWANCSAECI